jgi:hypothetical protein
LLRARALVGSATLDSTAVPIPGVELGLDGRVLTVALAASADGARSVTDPAFRILGEPAGAILRGGDRAAGCGWAVARGQRAVVAVQVAASLVLLAAAMIFSSFQRVVSLHDHVDPQDDSRTRASTCLRRAVP